MANTKHWVLLCHFCESHGPRVIFSTSSERDGAGDGGGDAGDGVVAAGDGHAAVGGGGGTSCPMCSSLDDGSELRSRDGEGYRFASRRAPLDADEYSRAAATAVRTLSGEVGDGALVYATEESTSTVAPAAAAAAAAAAVDAQAVAPSSSGRHHHSSSSCERLFVLAHLFRLSDVQARGFSRGYAVALLVPDAGAHLLSCFEWLSRQVRATVGDLRQSAQAVYDEESNSMRSANVQLERKSRFHAAKLRSLADLLRRPRLFHTLHVRFCWLLRSFRHAFALRPPAGHGLRPLPLLPAGPAAGPAAADALRRWQRFGQRTGDWRRMAALLDGLFSGDQVVVRPVAGGGAGAPSTVVEAQLALAVDALDQLCPIPSASDCVYASSSYLYPFQARLLGYTGTDDVPEDAEDAGAVFFDLPPPVSANDDAASASTSSASGPGGGLVVVAGAAVSAAVPPPLPRTWLGQQLLVLLMAASGRGGGTVRADDCWARWQDTVQLFVHSCHMFNQLRLKSADDPALTQFLDIVRLSKTDDLSSLRFWAAKLKRNRHNNNHLMEQE